MAIAKELVRSPLLKDGTFVLMDIDTERKGDKVFGEGAKVIVDRKSFLYLNGTELDGRTLTVNEAKPREDRGRGGGGYRGGRGGGGGGGRRDNW